MRPSQSGATLADNHVNPSEVTPGEIWENMVEAYCNLNGYELGAEDPVELRCHWCIG